MPDIAASAEQAAEKTVRDGFWRKLGRTAGHIPFAEDAISAYFCAFDSATPFRVRATLVGALAYFIVPADMMPDFLPLFGFVDDASVLAAALAAIGSHMNQTHRLAAARALGRVPQGEQAAIAPPGRS